MSDTKADTSRVKCDKSEYIAAADPLKYRIPDAVLFPCAAHKRAAVLCCTAGKIGRHGGHAAVGATVFWCTCPHINKLIARIERFGGVRVVSSFLEEHENVRALQCASHTVFENRVQHLLQLHSDSSPLWEFYRSHFVEPTKTESRKYGNAAVSHPEDFKCLHALMAQELCGAANFVGAAMANYVVFQFERTQQRTHELHGCETLREYLDTPDLLKEFLHAAVMASPESLPVSMQRLRSADWEYVWRSREDLEGFQEPDLCEMAERVIAALEGKPSRERKKRRIN